MDTCGVYAIYNTVNDKLYIGATVSMQNRFGVHKSQLKRGNHESTPLQRAWNEYGSEAFDFVCLEPVDREEKLIEREQAWLDALRPWDPARGYNSVSVAWRPPPCARELGDISDLIGRAQEYITAGEVARRLGVSVGRIRRLCIQGRIMGARKIGYGWILRVGADITPTKPRGLRATKVPGKPKK